MYYVRIEDNSFMVGQRCLGDILEGIITGCGAVDGRVAQYTFKMEDNNELLIQAAVNSDLDKFLGITSMKPIWIWCSENEIKAEISNYARLGPVRRRGGK
jgi:hypothetical protein